MAELWIAGVGAAAAVGGTVYAVASAEQQKAQAKKGAAGGKGPYPAYKNIPNVQAPAAVQYDPQAGARDFASILPSLTSSANAITANQTEQREKIMPGSADQFKYASNALQGYLQGQVPQDVVDETNRIVAERTGGTNNPFSGGGVAQSNFARNIGQTSVGLQQYGLSAAPAWQQLANSFVTNPLQVAPFAMEMGNQRYRYDALNSDQQYRYDSLNTGINTENAISNWQGGRNMWQDQTAMGLGAQAQEQAAINSGIAGLQGAAQIAGSYRGAGGASQTPALRPSQYRLAGGNWQTTPSYLKGGV